MSTLYTPIEAAKLLGTTERTIRRKCGDGIGVQLSGVWLLTAADIDQIRPLLQGRVGAPAGNKNWTRKIPTPEKQQEKPRKQAKKRISK